MKTQKKSVCITYKDKGSVQVKHGFMTFRQVCPSCKKEEK